MEEKPVLQMPTSQISRFYLRFQHFTTQRDDGFLDRDTAASKLFRLGGNPHQAHAARHFHVNHDQTPRRGSANDGRQLFHISAGVVQFRAADQQRPSAQELTMKIGHRRRHAIGRQEQVRLLQERRVRRHQMQLHGPIRQFRDCRFSRFVCRKRRIIAAKLLLSRRQKGFHRHAGTYGRWCGERGTGNKRLRARRFPWQH
jgi:hypothetical protein